MLRWQPGSVGSTHLAYLNGHAAGMAAENRPGVEEGPAGVKHENAKRGETINYQESQRGVQ